jgi:hypothetical protein
MHSASTVLSDLLWVLLVPPAVTFVWLLFSRGLTGILGTSDNDAVRGWTQSGFWIVLSLSYVVSIAMFLYAYFVKGR